MCVVCEDGYQYSTAVQTKTIYGTNAHTNNNSIYTIIYTANNARTFNTSLRIDETHLRRRSILNPHCVFAHQVKQSSFVTHTHTHTCKLFVMGSNAHPNEPVRFVLSCTPKVSIIKAERYILTPFRVLWFEAVRSSPDILSQQIDVSICLWYIQAYVTMHEDYLHKLWL